MDRTTMDADRIETAAAPARPAGRRRLLPRLAIGLAGALVAGSLAGFAVFLNDIPSTEQLPPRPADGIVVLTGGAFRISDAVLLLSEKQGKRLLVSGVNPATTPGELNKQIPDFARLSACCIDLGHQAQNTAGNALETARWARQHGFRSLIVVTSAWHMPRAILELERELPDVKLIRYPVVTDRMRDQSWWSNPQTARLLVYEYLKYLASLARVRIEPAEAWQKTIKTAQR